MPIEIIDRRGANKVPVVRPEVALAEEPEPDPNADRSHWKSVGFLPQVVGTPMGQLISMRSVGLRSDECLFVVDWLMPPIFHTAVDVMELSMKRLETYLNCNCSKGKMCGVHKEYMQKWGDADMERVQRIASQPMPEALEILMKAEQARQKSAVVAPGRG